MNVISLAWPMIDAALITVGIIHFGVWIHDRTQWARLSFAILAVASAAASAFELGMLTAGSIEEFAWAQRLQQVPVFGMTLALIIFTWHRLGTGRLSLAILALVLRLFALIAAFMTGLNLHFSSIDALALSDLFGAPATVVAAGAINPWLLLGQASDLALFAFIVDAVWSLKRRQGDNAEHRAVLVGLGLAIFVAVSFFQYTLITAAVVNGPYMTTPATLVIVVLMAYELGYDASRVSRLDGELLASDLLLRESGKRMALAAHAAGLGTWEWDIARDEVWATDGALALFGIKSATPIEFDRFLSPFSPENSGAGSAVLRSAIRQGGDIDHEHRVALPDGSERWVHSRGRVESEAGNPDVLRGVSIDVTERRQAQERFHRVFWSAPCGIILSDAAGSIELVNEKIEAQFGYSRSELIGQPVELLIPERSSVVRAAALSEALVGEPLKRTMSAWEVKGRHKDGSELALEIVVNTIRSSQGFEIIAMVDDVSERVQHLAVVKRERAFLRQVIDIAPTMLFARDREGRFTLANQAVADMYGTTVEGLIGKTGADFDSNSAEVSSFLRSDLDVMNNLHDSFIPEERITDAAGNVRWLQTIKRPILQSDGRSDQVLVSSTDITARRHAELELAGQRNELEHLSRVTMLSELSGSIAHELNQPLAAILSNAQAAVRFLAADEPNLQELREILLDIVSDDRRAGEIIKGLRLLLKKGQRRHELMDMNQIVREVLKLVNSDMLNAGVRVTTTLAPELPWVMCDQVQVQQVLLNLLLNGCDAMLGNLPPDREIAVTTAVAADSSVCICVSDVGHGVKADDLERVFEPFFTTKTHGLGLGLAVCRQIATAHGGRLSVLSGAGRGSTFCLALPLNAAATA